jgi:hypothetical protein
MKKILTFITVAAMLQSCGQGSMIPLKSDYSKIQNTFYSDKSKDVVWNNIVELFSKNGIGIQLIDKSSGLIISNKTDYSKTATTENASGKLLNEKAYVVVESYDAPMRIVPAENISATWNIRLFEKDNKTGININLTNIEATTTFPPSQYTRGLVLKYDAKSTGNFEKLIADSIVF